MKTAWRGFPATTSTFDPTTNTTYVASHDAFTVGAGLLDVYAAYMSTDVPTGSATSPTATYDATTKTVKISLTPLTGTSLVWGTTGPFATSLVWGTSTMQGFSLVWVTSSPWGCSDPTGEAVAIAINGEN